MTFIPTIDMRRFETDRQQVVDEVGHAYKTIGFCIFSHHGIDPDLIENTYRAFQQFFDLPLAIKMNYWSAHRSGKRGYTPLRVETAKTSQHPDLKEFWHVGRPQPTEKPEYAKILLSNDWPMEAPLLRVHAPELYSSMEEVGRRVLSIMALAIGLNDDFFIEPTRYGNSVLRGLHYPPTSSADAPCVRAHAHEDISLITLLLIAHGGGLQLLAATGQWMPVQAKQHEVVVNVGDMMQRLTNHLYVSTTHRVINPAGKAAKVSRYSMPFFMDPNPDYLIKTLPECITPANPDRYPQPITANEYLLRRLAEIKVVK